MRAVVTIPGVKLKTPGNSGHGRGHWAVAARHAKEQRAVARLYCSQLGNEVKAALLAGARLKVRFVRIGGRKMDPTNVVAACKHLIDGMCDWTGVDDSSDWYEWLWPAQESGAVGVRIELETVEGAA
jgi:hypothetical protein